MTPKYVISRGNLPIRLPTTQTIIVWLLLDRFNAPGWVCGVIAGIGAIIWLAAFIVLFTEKERDPFEGKRP